MPTLLVEWFAGKPEMHDPVRGRIKRVAAFRAFLAESSAWLRQHHVSVEDVEHVILDRRGFEQWSSTSTSGMAPSACPSPSSLTSGSMVASTNCRSTSPASHSPAVTPTASPWSSPTLGCPRQTPVAGYLRALAAGDLDASVAAFRARRLCPRVGGRPAHPQRSGRPERLLRAAVLHRRRHPSGTLRTRRRRARMRPCSTTSCGGARRGCRRRQASLSSSRSESGELAAVRVYDDIGPPLGPDASVDTPRGEHQEGSRRVSVLRLDRRLTTGPGAAHQRTILLRLAAGDTDTRLGGSCCG